MGLIDFIIIALLNGWLANQIAWQAFPKPHRRNPLWYLRMVKPFRCYYCMAFWLSVLTGAFYFAKPLDLQSWFLLSILSEIIALIWLKSFRDV